MSKKQGRTSHEQIAREGFESSGIDRNNGSSGGKISCDNHQGYQTEQKCEPSIKESQDLYVEELNFFYIREKSLASSN